MNILTLNGGSSSFKGALYQMAGPLPALPQPPVWQATLSRKSDDGQANLSVSNSNGQQLTRNLEPPESELVFSLEIMLEALWSGPTAVLSSKSEINAGGHRIVHGGDKYTDSVMVDNQVKAEILRLEEFAPLHNYAGLLGIEVVERLLGQIPQIAVFDTAFHRRMPAAATTYPIPFAWHEKLGIHRYGFHGINHQYCAERCAQLLARPAENLRIVTCHLGSGCSLAAIAGGISIDTTMGFTPLDGLMMRTRSGSLDPGILLYVLKHKICSLDELDSVLNHESGLAGISGTSGDMRRIVEAKAAGDQRAALAFDMFVHSLKQHIAAMAASLGGLDAVVFSGGIGEHSVDVRQAAVQDLSFLGISLDQEKNKRIAGDGEISTAASVVRVLVIEASENWAIAKQCRRMIADSH